MACEHDQKGMCYTFIWKVENADYWWSRGTSCTSPTFTVNEIDKTKWSLVLNFYIGNKYSFSHLYLRRELDNMGTLNVEIQIDLAFISSDGTVLHSFEEKKSVIEWNEMIGSCEFPSKHEVFFARRSEFISQDTLTVRCRIRKSVGEISKDVQCLARTRIPVEKRSFLWNIQNFSSNEIELFEIKSFASGEHLMTLELFKMNGLTCEDLMTLEPFLTNILNCEEILRLNIIPNCQNIKFCTLQLSIVNASKNIVNCFRGEFSIEFPNQNKNLTLFLTKTEIMEKKSAYLPNDVLSLLGECNYSFGNLIEEIEDVYSNCPAILNPESDKAKELSAPKSILINDLKSMLNNDMFSDVKLKTKSKTYPAHKLILGFRSPVFKAMFSNNMKENINDCVNIEDFSDETVLQMLRYLYSADVEELEWGRATELYEAADKYHILNLKDICSSFLKNNLQNTNACEALVLADLHQDEDLKLFVQDFILKQGQDIINSEEWDELMETNVKLAAETMRLKYKTLPK